MASSKSRHIAKTITWRMVGTIDTMLLAWFISGNPLTGFKIGIAEISTKMLLYYLHERLWFKSSVSNSKYRHLYKTFTWRILGTLDTVVLSWIISGDPLIGVKIGTAEIITKMILYFLHERIWYRFDYGIEDRDSR